MLKIFDGARGIVGVKSNNLLDTQILHVASQYFESKIKQEGPRPLDRSPESRHMSR